MPVRKILYSPGYGAGWVSWESDPELRKLMLTYQPIIEALERGEDISVGCDDLYPTDPEKLQKWEEKLHPAVKQFVADCRAMGKPIPYLGGLDKLKVAEVSGLVRIEEYDGYESYHEAYDDWL